MWNFFEKQPFFRADMAGLGKYHTGGYGRIGVYRVNYHIYKNFYIHDQPIRLLLSIPFIDLQWNIGLTWGFTIRILHPEPEKGESSEVKRL